ncbi:DNA-binding transcriptional LysR family regulator [Clostridium acetobutylicum]|uniref:Transcriptional regulators, LysR family n=1 Tax=Clostridium acetobutylicum (strain ATCC 824 / DSM 792 / JCM 1419 / IAM 19013 / LMG 5710 / NBRC 13948 / NRRL B-527 / VKM B-1787 / 2291 / W) TaxID=272562 RepID=Q97DR3_CLOAB|nr:MULTISPECIES: LysR family transcriptional regulator [Clostridium]AAK81339.1 Transcriptional regulators, LysR family [Clostridium acetobutylicum ATCC 824]ADZ22449.1 Transcriptional regulator, LysR family [Clostridium acetobutylicum EA 2018]AEI34465.1 LysR family transcriptional regulator [Clostridium acetobutylicum DSM 1731]AWV80994.1 LysR family transcriptional regulator [Clostridium acetobutylicum]MBC2395507.1 LysR family transcriptional regulator [Clostridium acetobutylicum]
MYNNINYKVLWGHSEYDGSFEIMEFRQLSYFISVAKYLSFTKAAEEHHIAQTAISQQISTLEKQLNVKLFVRNNRAVELTDAGRVLLKEADLITSRVVEAERKTKQAALGFEGSLNVGILGSSEKNFLPVILKRFHKLYPKIGINLSRNSYKKLADDMKGGHLDITFIFPYELNDISHVKYRKLFDYEICLVVNKEHRLARYKKIDVKEIKNEKFIVVGKEEAPSTVKQMRKNCMGDGFKLNVVAECKNLDTMLIMVEAGMGVALVPTCVANDSNNNISYIELENSKQIVEIGVAWMEGNMNPTLKLFLGVLSDLYWDN